MLDRDYPPLPAFVRNCTQADVAGQRIEWSAKEPWPHAFRNYAHLRAELEAEVRDHCGIRREFVFSHADDGPAELLTHGDHTGWQVTFAPAGGTFVPKPRAHILVSVVKL